jgi:tetratricopeptide (TPR) repeat protein
LEGQLQKADEAFTRAERLLPSDDKILLMHADLYRHALQQLPKTAESDRRALYEVALTILDEARAANPYRPLIDTLRGHIFEENRDLAGKEWFAQAEAAYTRALTLNPRFFGPRMRYARLLLEQGREGDAYNVLEEGMQHWYYPETEVLAYYQLTARLARNQRNEARVSEIEQKISQLRQDIARRATVRPVMPELNAAANRSAAI